MPTVSAEELVNRANREVDVWMPEKALGLHAAGKALLVDVRDIRELGRDGKVAGAFHAPRGMLEFWFDPASPYHKAVLDDPEKTYVFYCALGSRSALAAKAIRDMGFGNVAHVDGGYKALREAGAPIEDSGARPSKVVDKE